MIHVINFVITILVHVFKIDNAILTTMCEFKNILREIKTSSFKGSKIDFALKLVDRIFFRECLYCVKLPQKQFYLFPTQGIFRNEIYYAHAGENTTAKQVHTYN